MRKKTQLLCPHRKRKSSMSACSFASVCWCRLDDKLIASIKETVPSLWQDWNVTNLYLPKVRLYKCFWSFWRLGENLSKRSSAVALANCLTKIFVPGKPALALSQGIVRDTPAWLKTLNGKHVCFTDHHGSNSWSSPCTGVDEAVNLRLFQVQSNCAVIIIQSYKDYNTTKAPKKSELIT